MASRSQFLGITSLVIATLLYGLYGVFSRFIGTDFGIFFQAFARNLIVLFILSVYIFWKRTWKGVEKTDYKWFGLMIFPALLADVAIFVAFNNLAIGTALFVFYTSFTLGGYLLGLLLFQEELTKTKIISLLTCLLGLFILFSATLKQGSLFYLLLAISAGLGMTGWNIFSKKVSLKYSLAQVLSIDCLIFIIGSLPLAVLFKEPVSIPSFSIPWIAVFLYAFAAIGASLLTINGFRYLQAQIGSLIMLLQLVFGTLFGWVFFKEVLTHSFVVGGFLILLGTALPNLTPRTRTTKRS